MLYPGRTHWAHGESESGKSWVAQIAIVRVILAGGRVLYLDHESDPQEVTARLMALGARAADLLDKLVYVRPDESSMVVRNAAVVEKLLSEAYALAVVDGVTDALGLDKASTKDTDEVAAWMRRMPRRIAKRTGAAVIAIDHVTKDPDSRGRFAIGSQAKMAGIDGAAFVIEPDGPLGEGLVGEVVLRVAKDRPGSLRRHGGTYRRADRTQEIARITFDATDPKRIEVTVTGPRRASETVDGEPVRWRPTRLMERVSLVLEEHPEGLSSTAVQQLVTGKKDYIRQALDVLVLEGWVRRAEEVRGSATTYSHYSLHAYRESQDFATGAGPSDESEGLSADRARRRDVGQDGGLGPALQCLAAPSI